jgi:Holliday junction resolvase-like predicted endonuclease
MSELTKCKHFEIQNKVGICKKLDCICRCFLCIHSDQCQWIEKCAASDWSLVDNARDFLLVASRKLRDTIKNKIREISPSELVGGLLCRREEALLRAFTIAPGDIIEVQLVQKYLKDVPDLPASMIKQTDRFIDLFNLVIFRDSFDDKRRKIENGDMQIFATTRGLKQIQKMADNPREYMDDFHLAMEKIEEAEGCPSFELHNNVLYVWTKQMAEPLRWSRINDVPLEIISAEHSTYVYEIMEHMMDLGKAVEKDVPISLDKRDCFERAYRLYNSLVAIFRCLFRETQELRRAIKSLATNSTTINLAFKKLPDVENWELFVVEAYSRLNSENYLFTYDFPSPDGWQTKIPEGTFWASTLCFSFLLTNYNRILLNRYLRGWDFEERLRTALIDRNVKILHKNFPTPFGDIDYICQKGQDTFAIEAKDYSPWYRNWYMGAKIFEKRKTALDRKMNKFLQRVDWLKKNPEKAGINGEPIPICIGLYQEGSISFGISFNYKEMNKLFGPPKYPSYKEMLPQYEVSQDGFRVQAMGHEIYRQSSFMPSKGKKTLVYQKCPKYTSCVAIFAQNNPWLKESKAVGELCLALQKTFGGGPCPNFDALCIWAGFCNRGIDPSGFAKQLESAHSHE